MTVITPQSIKSYQLLERIGEGAYGAVYCAQQDFIEREVAIKLIQRATAKDPNELTPSAIALAEDYRRALQLDTFVPEEDIYNPYKGLRPFQEA